MMTYYLIQMSLAKMFHIDLLVSKMVRLGCVTDVCMKHQRDKGLLFAFHVYVDL